MKLLKSILITVFIGSFTYSCTNDMQDDSVEWNTESVNATVSSHVTFDDIDALYRSTLPPQTRTDAIADMDFIIDDENDTLFFVINIPGGGWKMYASDKRVPAVVADAPHGRFSLSSVYQLMGDWLEAMSEDMKAVKRVDDEALSFSKDEIAANRCFWDAVCDPNTFVVKKKLATRGGGLIPHDPDPIPNGHWELYQITTQEQDYDKVAHLTKTRWHQLDPYNMYCPEKTEIGDDGETRAPAGCIAIAAAQMIYFLHGNLGVPTTIPDSATCTGNIDSYFMQQWITGKNVWGKTAYNHGNYNQMEWDYDYSHFVNAGTFVAPLIANVGQLAGLNYGNNGSGTNDLSVLVGNVFNHYGISCQFGEFDESIVKTNLQSGMPVIASAYSIKKKKLFSTIYTGGHAFIIDGYKRKRIVTSYEYHWVDDSNDPNAIQYADRYEYTYSSPYITQINMNWGMGLILDENGQQINEIWVTPTGNWIAPDNANYQYRRKIIYGFQNIEQ